MMKNGSCDTGCCHGKHHTMYLLRVLITVVILTLVFWTGVATGLLAGQNHSYMMKQAFYPSMMRTNWNTSDRNDNSDLYAPMMGGLKIKDNADNAGGDQTTPATPQNY